MMTFIGFKDGTKGYMFMQSTNQIFLATTATFNKMYYPCCPDSQKHCFVPQIGEDPTNSEVSGRKKSVPHPLLSNLSSFSSSDDSDSDANFPVLPLPPSRRQQHVQPPPDQGKGKQRAPAASGSGYTTPPRDDTDQEPVVSAAPQKARQAPKTKVPTSPKARRQPLPQPNSDLELIAAAHPKRTTKAPRHERNVYRELQTPSDLA
jgi:hypothetical protein